MTTLEQDKGPFQTVTPTAAINGLFPLPKIIFKLWNFFNWFDYIFSWHVVIFLLPFRYFLSCFFFSLFLSLYCTFLSLVLLTSHLLKPLLFFILMEKDLKYLRFYRAICCYLSWLLNCRLPFSLFLLLMLIYIWN